MHTRMKQLPNPCSASYSFLPTYLNGHIRRQNSNQYPSHVEWGHFEADTQVSKYDTHQSHAKLALQWSLFQSFSNSHTHKGERHACTVRPLKLRCLGDQVNCDITTIWTLTRQYWVFCADCNSTGLLQLQNSFVPDEDLHGRNVVRLHSTVLREKLNVTTDI